MLHVLSRQGVAVRSAARQASPKPLTDDRGDLSKAHPLLHGTPKAPMVAGPNPREGQDIPSNVDADMVRNPTGAAGPLKKMAKGARKSTTRAKAKKK